MAHNRHGKLPWKDLFQPSIELAEKGFPLGKALARAIESNKEVILNDTGLCEVFCGKAGDVLKENETIKFTKLAETYRTIAEKGAEEFYIGQLAEDLVKDIQAAGYNFSADSVTTKEKKILTYHRIVEAYRFAYAKRSLLGDPKFLNIEDVS
ncbi:hypothetical protein XENOCAPTIV_009925 [Xenoophorus captivus]|uniref:Uncharacterized protein n=1 Tax=Xenoophorus captivus TaxID=1517983 RepID=A0ABV0QQX4_9TELE